MIREASDDIKWIECRAYKQQCLHFRMVIFMYHGTECHFGFILLCSKTISFSMMFVLGTGKDNVIGKSAMNVWSPSKKQQIFARWMNNCNDNNTQHEISVQKQRESHRSRIQWNLYLWGWIAFNLQIMSLQL